KSGAGDDTTDEVSADGGKGGEEKGNHGTEKGNGGKFRVELVEGAGRVTGGRGERSRNWTETRRTVLAWRRATVRLSLEREAGEGVLEHGRTGRHVRSLWSKSGAVRKMRS
ncbi:unnamed protein product, partial [Pylaiella littoralis]